MGFISILCPCMETRLRGSAAPSHDPGDGDAADTFDLFFGLHTLQLATNFFSELNQLGHGGFGPVYK
ncbi:hypothetical protein HN873_016601, partial [Arachis hypogaea]